MYNTYKTRVLPQGSTLGRYVVLERLGAGAMGVVYAAYDLELDRKVALRILPPIDGGDQDLRRARLVREAEAIAKVVHPNVVGIIDVGLCEGQVYLAMEHVEGGTLREWLAARTRPWREIVAMFVQIGKGLAGAHAAGVVHRAFKPDNILVCENGVPKIADLGLVSLSAALHASATGSDDALERVCSATAISAGASVGVVALTRKGALAGTPAYMAPEQFLGKAIDARTDQFAFCVALYEALYGARPFPGETVVTLADAVTSGKIEDTLPKGAVPGWIRTCLLRGLRVEAGLRYQSIDDVLAALTSDPWIRRRRLILTAVCGLAVVAGAIATQHFVSLR